MSDERTNFVTVFRTGQLAHLDWACTALDEAGIGYLRREETSGGLRVAMPAAPSVGPGTWWTVDVPERSAMRARELLARLPFEQTTTPEVWSFQPKPTGKLAWQLYAWIALGVMVIGVLIAIVNHLR